MTEVAPLEAVLTETIGSLIAARNRLEAARNRLEAARAGGTAGARPADHARARRGGPRVQPSVRHARQPKVTAQALGLTTQQVHTHAWQARQRGELSPLKQS
jgi:hypothetical protein